MNVTSVATHGMLAQSAQRTQPLQAAPQPPSDREQQLPRLLPGGSSGPSAAGGRGSLLDILA